MTSAPATIIEIKPNIEYLSAAELIEQRHAVAETPRIGLKRTTVEGTVAEHEELQRAYAALRQQLSVRRIERQAGRAVAVWHVNQQVAEVLRKDGKFDSFGFSDQGKLYLEYYEALFLLEVNRLQLEFCGMIMSVEQAYVLLLGEAGCEKFNSYLVYSALSRAGYIVVKHQSADVNNDSKASSNIPVTSEDCIWAILEESLRNKPVPENIRASTFYKTTQTRMAGFIQQIISQTTVILDKSSLQGEFQFNTRKRRAQSEPDEESASKRAYETAAVATTANRSLIDKLKDEANYLRFKQIFKKFDIVQLNSAEFGSGRDGASGILKITFDLHLHNEGFKRSASKMPSFSVAILSTDDPFPTHDDIVICQRQQLLHGAPLLIMSVGESKQIQAFLYYST